MNSLPVIFFAITAITGLMATFILFALNKERRHTNNMLAFAFFALALTSLNLFLFYSQYILRFPWVYKLSSPINMLVAPAVFIYVRSLLYEEERLRKNDWLFLIPTVIHAADMFPFFIMATEEKRQLLAGYFENPYNRIKSGSEGLIFSQQFINIFRVIWSDVICLFSLIHVFRFKKIAGKKLIYENKVLLKWLYFLPVSLIVMITTMLILYTLVASDVRNLALAEYVFGTVFLLIVFQLFSRPVILYGLYLPSVTLQSVNCQETDNKNSIPGINDIHKEELATILTFRDEKWLNKNLEHKKTLETLFETEMPFLKPGYSLEQMARDLRIPKNTLSAFINREFGVGFTELINRNRVEYIIRNLKKPEWKNITLDSIGYEAGFGSKTAFFSAFKKETGITPAQFIRQQSVES